MPDCIVSVIIPCYNTSRFIGEAIESVLNQTFIDFELLIIDDGSTDNSKAIIKSYSDPRIHSIHQDNQGLSAARNMGLSLAGGRYISFLDADDTFYPSKLQDQVAFLEHHPEYGLVTGGFSRTNESGEISGITTGLEGEIEREQILTRSQFPVHTTLIRKRFCETVGLFDRSFTAAEDWDYYVRLALAGCRMYRTTNIVASYRCVKGSMSQHPGRQTEMLHRVVGKAFASDRILEEEKPLRPIAERNVNFDAACRSFALGYPEFGTECLNRIRIVDGSLTEPFFDSFLRALVNWLNDPMVEDPRSRLNAFFSSSILSSIERDSIRHKGDFLYRKGISFRHLQKGNYLTFFCGITTLFARHPLLFVKYYSTRGASA